MRADNINSTINSFNRLFIERWPGTILGFTDTEVDKTVKMLFSANLHSRVEGEDDKQVNKQDHIKGCQALCRK